jgi:hypothetical protein
MNIFVLSKSPVISAQEMCDKHVVKMILESAQMLSTAHRILDGDDVDEILYKKTHANHPCTKWCRNTNNNYNWLYAHFRALCDEYTFRYGKIHKTEQKLDKLLSVPPINIDIGHLQEFPIAISEDLRHLVTNDVHETYRKYYKYKQGVIDMRWTNRNMPQWMKGE